MVRLKNKIKQFAPLLLAFVPVAVFYFTFGCPIKFFTGVSCFGCGMSRAAWALLRLDFAQAIYFHPLVFIMPIMAIILLFKGRIPCRVYKSVLWFVFALFVVVYFYRLVFSNGDIVCFEPQNSFICKLFS